jgi:hypothetical protein
MSHPHKKHQLTKKVLDYSYIKNSALWGLIFLEVGFLLWLSQYQWANSISNHFFSLSTGIFAIGIFYFFHERHHIKNLDLLNIRTRISQLDSRTNDIKTILLQTRRNNKARGRTMQVYERKNAQIKNSR